MRVQNPVMIKGRLIKPGQSKSLDGGVTRTEKALPMEQPDIIHALAKVEKKTAEWQSIWDKMFSSSTYLQCSQSRGVKTAL